MLSVLAFLGTERREIVITHGKGVVVTRSMAVTRWELRGPWLFTILFFLDSEKDLFAYDSFKLDHLLGRYRLPHVVAYPGGVGGFGVLLKSQYDHGDRIV